MLYWLHEHPDYTIDAIEATHNCFLRVRPRLQLLHLLRIKNAGGW